MKQETCRIRFVYKDDSNISVDGSLEGVKLEAWE